jgi:DNA-binding transcriptional regulator/RsmH inhibitor MraZ
MQESSGCASKMVFFSSKEVPSGFYVHGFDDGRSIVIPKKFRLQIRRIAEYLNRSLDKAEVVNLVHKEEARYVERLQKLNRLIKSKPKSKDGLAKKAAKIAALQKYLASHWARNGPIPKA